MNQSLFFSNEQSLGCHVSLKTTLLESLKNCCELGVYNPQFFFGSPYSATRRKFKQDDIEESNIFLKHSGLNVFTHLPYIYNLAGSVSNKKLAYTGCKETDSLISSYIKSIEEECNCVGNINCCKKGCVLHMGSVGKGGDWEEGCKTIAKSINNINFVSDSAPLLLETMVGKGGVLGKNYDELALVYSLVEDKDKIGFCLDTCHIFSEGNYDLGTINGIDKCFEDFDRILGLNKLSLVHLNDSCCEINSKADRHQSIGEGYVWKDKIESFRYFIKRCKQLNVPFVLETSLDDVIKVNKILMY